MSSHLLKTTCFLLVLALTSSCTKSKSPVEAEPAPPMGIVWGESIEGVAIGDDSSSVVAKLGPPTSIAIGDFAGYTLFYEKGNLARTFVTISTDDKLILGVIGVTVTPPYKGATKSGIGLGSERNSVINQIGQPDEIADYAEIYNYEKNEFHVRYDNGRVEAITMRWPWPY